MKNPFWNSEQRRVRALWRLVAQALLFAFGTMVLGIVEGIGFAVLLAAQPGGAALISDPAAMVQAIAGHPLSRLVGTGLSMVAVFGSVWFAGRFLDRRRFADFGFHFGRDWWLDFAFGLALGALLMAGIFLAEWAAGWVRVTGTLQPGPGAEAALPGMAIGLLAYIAVGIYEELWTRGYQLRNLAEGLSGRLLGNRGAIVLAWLVSSAVFGALHAGNPNATLVSTANLVVAGLFLGLGYILTGELAIPIGLHISWNFFQGNVFGFPVSGTHSGATLLAIAQGGPAMWTGGAFGPEAGLVGLAAILAGSALIVAWVRVRRGRSALWRPLAEPPQRLAAEG